MSQSKHAAFPAILLGLAVLGLSGVWPSTSWAQMYRWTDEQGGTHYSQGIYTVPERFRSRAQPLTFPERAAAPAASPLPAESVVAQGARIAFTPGKPIMVSARINGGGSAQLMLDTGASVTVINPRILAGMGIGSREALRGSVKGATGSADVLFVPVASIEVGGARSGPLRVAAHDVDLGHGDGLLGRDFLDQFTVNIDSTAGFVTISPK
jgi:predicted aspartyl protease